MSSSDRKPVNICKGTVFLAFAAFLATGCTVEPLANASRDSALVSGSVDATISQILARTDVKPVSTRVGQQVRNRLLFAMNGGRLQPGGRYSVRLATTSQTVLLSVQSSSLAPTSAQVQVSVTYSLLDATNSNVLRTGTRKAFAAYDRTPQSFANLRAERDAQNRAAREVAEQLRLAIAQDISKL